MHGKPRIRRTYCYEVWLHDNYAFDETYHSVYSDQATAEQAARLMTLQHHASDGDCHDHYWVLPNPTRQHQRQMKALEKHGEVVINTRRFRRANYTHKKNVDMKYIAPSLNIVHFVNEKGFANSTTNETGFNDYNGKLRKRFQPWRDGKSDLATFLVDLGNEQLAIGVETKYVIYYTIPIEEKHSNEGRTLVCIFFEKNFVDNVLSVVTKEYSVPQVKVLGKYTPKFCEALWTGATNGIPHHVDEYAILEIKGMWALGVVVPFDMPSLWKEMKAEIGVAAAVSHSVNNKLILTGLEKLIRLHSEIYNECEKFQEHGFSKADELKIAAQETADGVKRFLHFISLFS